MPLEPGARLGAYEIVSLLGAGGMGEVYSARDTRLERLVAIKVLPSDLSADVAALRRFEREARAISSLDHPNICSLYDIGREGPVDYLVMQYLQGETLAERLRRGPLGVDEAIQRAIEIARALDAAHQRGVVHRDLKPGNVMLTATGAKLLDFGLAATRHGDVGDMTGATRLETRAFSSSTRHPLTESGTLLGTLPYMAPERLKGDVADARSDIFALGAVLFEMIAGRRAFVGTSEISLITAILDTEPPPLSEVRASAPPRLNPIVRRCLAKVPAERWQTAHEIVLELTHLPAAGRAAATRPLVIAAAVLAAAVALGVYAIVSRPVPEAAVTAPAPAQPTTLALLPFESDSANPADRAYWTGLTQTIGTQLAGLPATRHLHVIAATDAANRPTRTAADARAELGATRVLRGSTRIVDGAVQAQFELVDTATDRPVRTARVVIDRRDPVAAQNRILEAIVSMLDVTLTARERAALAPPQMAPGAYAFYLQGLGYMQDYDRPEQLDTAITMFQQALAIDADHAPAYAGLGQAYWRRYDSTRDVKWAEIARQNCERALGLDEAEAAPHLCLGTVENGVGRYEKAVEEFRHALDREPENEIAHLGLAVAYQRLGDFPAAEAAYRRGLELRPNYWLGYSRLGAFYYSQARYADAETAFRQVIALSPDSWRGHSNLGGVLYVQGRMPEAIASFETSMSIRPNYQAASNLGTLYYFDRQDYARAARAFQQALALNDGAHVVWGNYADALQWSGDEPGARRAYARAAELAEARRKVNPRDAQALMALAGYRAALGDTRRSAPWVEQALAIAPDNPQLMFNAAVIYEHRLADRDTALRWLERAVARGHPWNEIEKAPGLARLRDDPRFRKLRESQASGRGSGPQGG